MPQADVRVRSAAKPSSDGSDKPGPLGTTQGRIYSFSVGVCFSLKGARLSPDVSVKHMRRYVLLFRVMDNWLASSVGHRVSLMTSGKSLFAKSG